MTQKEKNQIDQLTLAINALTESINAQAQLLKDMENQLNTIRLAQAQANKATSDTKKADTKKSTTPKKATPTAKKDYGTPVFTADKNFVKYTNADGSFVAHKAIRQILNDRIKALGGKWDKDAMAWAFNTQKLAKDCVAKIDRVVTQAQIDAQFKAWSNK